MQVNILKLKKIWYHYNNGVRHMPSRMERYYQTEVNVAKRTRKNQHLYDDIHNSLTQPNVEQISNVNEISPAKLNELLNSEKKVERRAIRNENLNLVEDNDDDENKNYDIREVLEKAKTDRPIKNDYHKLKEEQLSLLKKIESYKASKQEQDDNLNELLNTIASTKLLKDLNDRDLSLDLLGDLKSNNENTIVGGIDSINRVMSDIPKVKKEIEENNEIDKSFYTSSMSFNDDDFDDIKEIKNKLKKNNFWMKAMIITLCIVIIAVIVLVVVLI